MDSRVAPPKIIGHEASAVVAERGPGVEDIAVGDRVAVRPLQFGAPTPFDKGCSHVGKNLKFIGIDSPGAMQSSWTVPAYTLHKLPETISLPEGGFGRTRRGRLPRCADRRSLRRRELRDHRRRPDRGDETEG